MRRGPMRKTERKTAHRASRLTGRSKTGRGVCRRGSSKDRAARRMCSSRRLRAAGLNLAETYGSRQMRIRVPAPKARKRLRNNDTKCAFPLAKAR